MSGDQRRLPESKVCPGNLMSLSYVTCKFTKMSVFVKFSYVSVHVDCPWCLCMWVYVYIIEEIDNLI